MAVQFLVNGKSHTVDVRPDMPLLWVLRDTLNMTGTKFGCGMALCGACTVHIEGAATRSCITPISAVAGKRVTTIEGLSADPQPSRAARLDRDRRRAVRLLPVGTKIMSAAALLAKTPEPTDAQIDTAMTGNICRCGTYQRIREAIHRAAKMQAAPPKATAAEPAPDVETAALDGLPDGGPARLLRSPEVRNERPNDSLRQRLRSPQFP